MNITKLTRGASLALVICALTLQPARAVEPEDLMAYWSFNQAGSPEVEDTGSTPDLTLSNADQTEDAGGYTGEAGDYALDLGGHNNQGWGRTAAGDHLEDVNNNDTYAVALWQFNRQQASTSTFWIHAPSSSGNQRGIQAHVPWGNGTIFLDRKSVV